MYTKFPFQAPPDAGNSLRPPFGLIWIDFGSLSTRWPLGTGSPVHLVAQGTGLQGTRLPGHSVSRALGRQGNRSLGTRSQHHIGHYVLPTMPKGGACTMHIPIGSACNPKGKKTKLHSFCPSIRIPQGPQNPMPDKNLPRKLLASISIHFFGYFLLYICLSNLCEPWPKSGTKLRFRR